MPAAVMHLVIALYLVTHLKQILRGLCNDCSMKMQKTSYSGYDVGCYGLSRYVTGRFFTLLKVGRSTCFLTQKRGETELLVLHMPGA